MRVFKHPNIHGFKCPVCGTAEDSPVVLIKIYGTEKDGIMEAEQFHVKCLDLMWLRDKNVIYMVV